MKKETIQQIKDFDIVNPSLWAVLVEKVSNLRLFLIGLVITIGSVGLLLGALTCAIASVAIVFFQVELVPAMLIGFFSVGVMSLGIGLLILKASIPK